MMDTDGYKFTGSCLFFGHFSLLGRIVFVDSDRFCIVRGASVQGTGKHRTVCWYLFVQRNMA